jgi:acyl-CoA thioesterase FadM
MIDLRGDDGRPRVSGRVVLVFLDLETRRSMPVPEILRTRMEAYRIPEPAEEVA